MGTSDLREVERRIDEGDEFSRLIFDGMVYAQAKDIGAMSTTMDMDVDAIVLTGGMAHSKRLVDALTARGRQDRAGSSWPLAPMRWTPWPTAGSAS